MPQGPIIVPAEAEAFSAICDQCTEEKNSPFVRERGWAPAEDRSDVRVEGKLPLGVDELHVKCPYGHEHLVLRLGSQRAANFGFGPHSSD